MLAAEEGRGAVRWIGIAQDVAKLAKPADTRPRSTTPTAAALDTLYSWQRSTDRPCGPAEGPQGRSVFPQASNAR